MFIIHGILVSDELVENHFVCDLQKCKGACCWEGDFGAPLEEQEISILESEYSRIRDYLLPESRKLIDQKGLHAYYREAGHQGTVLRDDGACVFMTRDTFGIARCGIEMCWKDGLTDFIKPVSCHLYPVRVKKDSKLDFEAVNYDDWEICAAACTNGKKLNIPLYQFVKDALIRKYGKHFYDEIEAYAAWKNQPD